MSSAFLACDTSNRGYGVPVLKKVGNCFLIIALLTATNSQWFLLQSIAWASMIVRYSEKAPLKVALMHTFDGKHPCCLCKAIAAAKRSEKKKEFPLQTRKLEFLPLPQDFTLAGPTYSQFLPAAGNVIAASLTQKPLLQPPRRFFV